MRFFVYILCCLVLFFSCRKQETNLSSGEERAGAQYSDSIYYARGFRIETHPHFKLVQINNPWHSNQTLQTYILVSKADSLPEHLPPGIVIRTPLEKTVVFSSVICGILSELDALSSLAGVAEPEYVAIPSIQSALACGKIQDVGRASQPDIEKLMLIEPEAIISNPVNEAGARSLGKLTIPSIPCLEWMENHPLGQTEWIRLIGLFFEKAGFADSLFFATVHSYHALKALTDTITCRPSVFAEKKYGDFWHMPGGQSYFAHLLNDAGADYIFKDNPATGSVPFAFETILEQAGKADFWLFKYYSSQDMTYRQLADEFANYALFDAYKKHQIFTCNTLKTPFYYQELPLHPDWVLRDLIRIFHPALLPEDSGRYYFKMQE